MRIEIMALSTILYNGCCLLIGGCSCRRAKREWCFHGVCGESPERRGLNAPARLRCMSHTLFVEYTVRKNFKLVARALKSLQAYLPCLSYPCLAHPGLLCIDEQLES